MLVTTDKLRQFREEGYFILESVIDDAMLADLRLECQRFLDAQIADMERAGAEKLGLSQKDKRYSLACHHSDSAILTRFVFSELLFEIVKAVVGGEAYVFLELFAVKCSQTGIPLEWHQDSGYMLGLPHKPYVSVWCALDDMAENNGALAVLPFNQTGIREVTPHLRDKRNNDFVGYRGNELGELLCVPRGSIIVMSSLTFHRSGHNLTEQPRRAYLVSYSSEPITDQRGNLWNQATPFIKDGERINAQEI